MGAASATLMVLARVLPDKESYGAICQLLVLYMALSQIFSVGLPQSIYYFLPRCADGERRGFLTQTMLLLALSGALLGTIFALGSGMLAHLLHSPRLTELLEIFAWYPLFMLPTLGVESAMLHANRPLASVIYNASSRVVMFGSLVVPTLLGADLADTVTIWVLGAAAMGIIGIGLVFSVVRGEPLIWQSRMLRDEWAFSMPLAVSSLLTISAMYLDRLLISHNFGPVEMGNYYNATVLLSTLGMVANSGAVVLMSELSRRSSSGEVHQFLPIWHNALVKAGVLLLAALGVLVFWHDETMQLLFSRRFAESGDILRIYVWMIPALLFIVQSLFVSLGDTRAMLLVSLVNLLMVGVCLYVGSFFGILGIAAGAVAARYLGVFYAAHLFIKRLNTGGWSTFMPWAKLGATLAVALVAGLISRIIMLPFAHWPYFLDFAAGTVIFLVLYLTGLHWIRLLHYLVPRRFLPARWYARQEVAS